MPNEEDTGGLPEGPFDGAQTFHGHFRAALGAAAASNWREIVLSDPDFGDWPLGERAVVDALQAWSAAGRGLVLLAQRFDLFERHHARFVQWRKYWSHIVDCRACNGPGLPEVPSALWTPTWCIHRIDIERARGFCGHDAQRRRAVRERIDECLRHAKPAFPVTTLGL